MARLIPQKQIEEINIFKDSISVANSVFISGSLYVSQSVNIGNSLLDKQEITGSVEITGSLTVIDGIITGDGSGLRNIDIANLAIDSSRIFTGSVTASVQQDGFFRVGDGSEFNPVKSEFSGSVFVSESLYVNQFLAKTASLIVQLI